MFHFDEFRSILITGVINSERADMKHLSSLSIELSNPRKSVEQKLKMVCNAVKTFIPNCNRVGIWLFSQDYQEMVQLQGVDALNDSSHGLSLLADDYKQYFEHVLSNRFLVASSARTCDVASCFNEGYFDVFDVHSLLDFTFYHDFDPLGVICCERTGDETIWTEEDKANLKRIAGMTSTFLAENVSNTYSRECKKTLLDNLSQAS